MFEAINDLKRMQKTELEWISTYFLEYRNKLSEYSKKAEGVFEKIEEKFSEVIK